MLNEKQAASNRQNALRSTGPRTAEGKAVSCCNALKHRALASRLLILDENPEEFLEFSRGIEQEFQPQGDVECYMVERIISTAWRLRRVIISEAGAYNGTSHTNIHLLARYESMVDRSMCRAIIMLERMQAVRRRGEAPEAREPVSVVEHESQGQ